MEAQEHRCMPPCMAELLVALVQVHLQGLRKASHTARIPYKDSVDLICPAICRRPAPTQELRAHIAVETTLVKLTFRCGESHSEGGPAATAQDTTSLETDGYGHSRILASGINWTCLRDFYPKATFVLPLM